MYVNVRTCVQTDTHTHSSPYLHTFNQMKSEREELLNQKPRKYPFPRNTFEKFKIPKEWKK